MTKINFTATHRSRLNELATEMLFNGTVINGNMGQNYTVYDLIHTTTLNTLRSLYQSLHKAIEKAEAQDEWVATDTDQRHLDSLKTKKEFINLLIGFKRYQNEQEANLIKKRQLEAELATLLDSQKTPEDRIKELQEAIRDLGE